MRIALLLLVAANLLAFAWGQGWLAPIIGDVRQPQRMERQVGPERLRVLRRDEPGPKERAVAGRVESDEPRSASAGRDGSARETGSRPGSGATSSSGRAGPTDSTRPAAEPAAGAASAPGTPSAESNPSAAKATLAPGTPTASGTPTTPTVLPAAAVDGPADAPGAGPAGRNRDAGTGLDELGLREMASPRADSTTAAASEASPPRAAALEARGAAEARPDAGAGAETPRAAPAVPFGLAEPPITPALSDRATQLASAASTRTSDAVADDSPPTEAQADRAAPAPVPDAPAFPGNLETGAWPAPLPPVARKAPACFDLRGLDAVRAEAVREQLEEMGATSVEERAVENRSGYIVHLPASETVEQAQARIAQLREQGVRDIYLVMDGTYRLSISLGVFNRMDSVELALAELRARGVEDAEVGFMNPAATRVTLRVRGPEELLDEEHVRAVANLRGGQLSRCS